MFKKISYLLLYCIAFFSVASMAFAQNQCIANLYDHFDEHSCRLSVDPREYHCFRLANCNLTDKDIPAIFNFFDKKHRGGSVILNLAHNKITAEGAKLIAEGAKQDTIVGINLSDNQLGDEGAITLANIASLMELHLGKNQIGNEGVAALANNFSLRYISLDNNRFDNTGIATLAKLSTLWRLDVSNNHIDSEGMALLGNLSLKELTAINNKIGDAGVIAFVQKWQPRGFSTYFNFTGNQIGDAGAEALARVKNSSVFFGLAKNKISDKGVEALAHNPNLVMLDISNNLITDEGVVALAKNRTLQYLDLSRTHIGLKSFITLVGAKNNCLQYLAIQGMYLNDAAVHVLTLKEWELLDVKNNPISKNEIEQLKLHAREVLFSLELLN